MKTILYIHGMGGGGDSRIPRLLRERLEEEDVRVIVRTYDFDPETGHAQLLSWVQELQPSLLIGESLGAVQTLRLPGIPQLFVSPALGAPALLSRLAWVTRLPSGSDLLHRIWRVKEGDRQALRFEYAVLRKYGPHGKEAERMGEQPGFRYAFFGRHDHYRKWGVVRIADWRKRFGDTYQIYDGSHFMEEEFIDSMLVPKIREVLAEVSTLQI